MSKQLKELMNSVAPGAQVIPQIDSSFIRILEKDVFAGGMLKPMPFFFWEAVGNHARNTFMHKHGIYVLPTTELIDWLRQNIIGSAIEIGAGNGSIGRALGIPVTDLKIQERDDIKLQYIMMNQPVIKYPGDVEKIGAIQAIQKYKPDTVIGAFITPRYTVKYEGKKYSYGIMEDRILGMTKRYINIGNRVTHKDKPIRKEFAHAEFYFPWIITRSIDQGSNRIWVFDHEE